MIATTQDLINVLSKAIPADLLKILLSEYQDIKTQFALGRYRPDELSGGRYAETYLRILELLGSPTHTYTPIGVHLNRSYVVNSVKNTGSLDPSLRIFVLPLLEVLVDVRNRRNVAHIGYEIDPNFSDSRLVCQLADWSLIELIRLFSQCSIIEAQKIVDRITLISVPIVAEVEGFVRVLDTKLKASEQVLVILHHKQPEAQKDVDLCTWIKYQNFARFKSSVLGGLNKIAFIHYDDKGFCHLLPSGVIHVEKNIELELLF